MGVMEGETIVMAMKKTKQIGSRKDEISGVIAGEEDRDQSKQSNLTIKKNNNC